MRRREIEESWNRIGAHIEQALAAFVIASDRHDAEVHVVREYLEHNELELAADHLANISTSLVTSDAVWAPLASAASEMRLDRRASSWQAKARYPCPCCGHLTYSEPPGSYNICPVCFWEDDVVQLRWPEYAGGANRPSLIKAQQEYTDIGAMESRFTGKVRKPTADEPIDGGWRQANPRIDGFERWDAPRDPWPDDYTTLYWWRPTFWRQSR